MFIHLYYSYIKVFTKLFLTLTPLILRSRSDHQDVDLQELGGVGSGGQGGIFGVFLRVRYPICSMYLGKL